MTDYTELIQRLRNDSKAFTGFANEDFLKAADAIEDLQKQLRKSEADNVNLTGWLAEEHAKHLWIPVAERLPDHHGHYLVNILTPDISWLSLGFFTGVKFIGDGDEGMTFSHWMPLPEPPEVKP